MTTTTTDYPRSLREHLDAGGTLDGFDSDITAWLCEVAVEHRHLFGIEVLRRQFERSENNTPETRLARWDELLTEVPGRDTPDRRQNAAREAAFVGWEAELVHDEALCDRVQGLLPPELVQEALDNVASETTPYRLVVQSFDSYRCGVTGDECHGPAIVLEGVGSIDRDNLREGAGHWKSQGLDVEGLVFSPGAVEAALRQARLVAEG